LFLFHGEGVVDPHLVGMHVGAERFTDRDLIFSTWTGGGPERMGSLLRERTGARLVPAIVLWLAATAAMLALASRRSNET